MQTLRNLLRLNLVSNLTIAQIKYFLPLYSGHKKADYVVQKMLKYAKNTQAISLFSFLIHVSPWPFLAYGYS